MPNKSSQIILQLYARAPAPCRDYCGLTITHTEVILNTWHISFGPHVYPKRTKCDLEDFVYDKMLQSEIGRIYGQPVLEYTKSFARKERNLQTLPTKVFLNILNFLAVRDIRNVSQTSQIFFNRCNMDNVWKILFRKYVKRKPDPNEMIVAKKYGWKETLKLKRTTKTTKLQTPNSVSSNQKNQKKVEVKLNSKTTLKNSDNKVPPPKVTNSIQNNKKIINKPAQLTQKRATSNNKLDFSKSTSALLEPGKNYNRMKFNQMSSTINLDKVSKNLIKKTLPQVKNDLKVGNFPQLAKKADITIEVPMAMKKLMTRNKSSIHNTNNLLKK